MKFYILKSHFFSPGLATLDDWRFWAAGKTEIGSDLDAAPDISFIPPMQRRRLSQSVRMTLSTVHALGDAAQNLSTVYASRFGEWETTSEQFKKFKAERAVSPAAFGLSVHNAGMGVLSLLNKNNKSYNSVSAHRYTFDMGLMDAIARLPRDGQVLYLYTDEKIPDIYMSNFAEKLIPLSLGLILSSSPPSCHSRNFLPAPAITKNITSGAVGDAILHSCPKQSAHNACEALELDIEFNENQGDYASNYLHVLDFIRFLLTDAPSFTGKNFKVTKSA